MSREILRLMSDADILEGMALKLKNDGFNEKTISDLLAGAEKIMGSCTRAELCGVVFSADPERGIRPFIDSIFPYISFNKIGWYGVALRILGGCMRELAEHELTEEDKAALARLRDDDVVETDTIPCGISETEPSDKSPYGKKESIAAKKAARKLHLPFPSAEDARQTFETIRTDPDFLEKSKCITELIAAVGKENKDFKAVYAKVEMLSAMFGPADLDREAIARQIVSCDIDKRLEDGDENAVTLLTWTLHDDNHRDLYMFAVRYCAAHNPEKFPFFNAATVRSMKFCRDNHGFFNFSNDELLNYPKYKKLLNIFREKYGLEDFSLSEISCLLTFSGKLLAGK